MKLEPAVQEEWAKFPNLPGTHLSLRSVGSVGRKSQEIVTSDGVVWASWPISTWDGTKNSAITAGGQTYRWVQVSKSTWWEAALKAIGAIFKRADDARELVDSVGRPALRVTGHHFNRKANTSVTVLDHATTITLPVKGWNSSNGMMSAIADSGTTLVEYRMNASRWSGKRALREKSLGWSRDSVEIVVTPSGLLLPAIELLVAVTYNCLPSYYDSGGSF
jgi:hypothetical protein